ncbi:transcription antitermination factor NusB [Azovibrio restrictus]|uniref:transcription antitermination factor NusB n=1 Tax=Azovibrio restrictus TaxID=146938 RepID=UPI0026F1971E|nr:transcription antitermination factor NusB [Azovibrio restrictus]
MTEAKTGAPKVPPKASQKSPRRRAREFALQGLYQWRVGGADEAAIEAHLPELEGYKKADETLCLTLIRGVLRQHQTLEAQLAEALDRPFGELSPIEANVLLMATYELAHFPETPYRVIINEAIELAKVFGGTDGHRYVNGVLDKMAARLRTVEVQAWRKQR